MNPCMSPNAAFDHRYSPPSPGMREPSSSMASAIGRKKTINPSNHMTRLDGPICAAVDSHRKPTMAAMLSNTRSHVPSTRLSPCPAFASGVVAKIGNSSVSDRIGFVPTAGPD